MMITGVDIISQPYSGQYIERIFDISSLWNSSLWTWIKFINEDLTEWCGEFRGVMKAAVISLKYNLILILTSDYLYKLSLINGELLEYEENQQYNSLTVTPLGDFIIANYYSILLMEASSITDKKELPSPVKMDNIKFHNWNHNKLQIICDELLNWNYHGEVVLELDCETMELYLK